MKLLYSLLFCIIIMPFSINASKLPEIKEKISHLNIDSIGNKTKFLRFCLNVYKWGDRTFNTYDTSYVVGTGRKFNIKLKETAWSDHFVIPSNKKDIVMTSEFSSNIGVSLAFMAVSVGYTFDISRIQSRKNWDFKFTTNRLAIDAHYYKNDGSTYIKHFGSYNDGNRINVRLDNIHSESKGVNLYYIFNNQKYAQGAAFNFSKIQKRSAGSFYAGAMINSYDMSFPFYALPDDMTSVFDEDDQLKFFSYTSYCAMFGYGYNFVPHSKWLLNATVLPSLGYRREHYPALFSNSTSAFTFGSLIKASCVYNYRDFFVGGLGEISTSWYINQDDSIYSSIISLNFITGWRF